jgi:D-alanyl-lipoteichoic acid acyltransferase DltB (MBOAT superfamily)
MPQLKMPRFLKEIEWGAFARLTAWGYFKKLVIADNLNLVVTPVFAQVQDYNGAELILAGFLFVVQVYCDFSGYSDIATGVAKLFKINLSLNWLRPLLSTSLHAFWRRNHISITTWFRDYLYISLGGNRVSYQRWLLNIFLVFVISGLWHGPNITFIIWGAIHGLFYLFEILFRKQFPGFQVPGFLGWLYLISLHTLSLIAFRANNLTDLVFIYKKVFSRSGSYFDFSHLFQLQDKIYYLVFAFMLGLLFLKELLEEFSLPSPALREKLRGPVYAGLIILIFIVGNFSANTFIYFQF